MPGLDEVLSIFQDLVRLEIQDKINEHKLDVESYGTSLSMFEDMYMSHLEGNEVVEHTLLRSFIRYQQAYNDYRFNTDANTVLGRIKYLTPQPSQTLSEGEIPAIVQNLVLSGAGVLPEAAIVTPDKVGFDFNRHIVKGQWAYNEDEDKWYYLSKTGVKELKTGSDVDLSTYATKEELNNVTVTLGNLQTTVTQNGSEIALKATQTDVDALGTRVATAEAAITLNANEILLRATKTEVDALGIRVSNTETAITQNSQAITLRATKDELNALGETVGSHTTLITQNADAISLKAEKSVVDELGNTVVTMQSSITQTASDISLLVETGAVKGQVLVEAINGQSAVKISADKINISGLTTFAAGYDPSTKVSTGGSAADINANVTTINGGKITANTITTLGKIESFTGLYVKNDNISDADKYVFGVNSYMDDTTKEVYPKLFLGRRRTTATNASSDAGMVVERDTSDGKYKFHIGNDQSFVNFDGEKLTIGGATITQKVGGVDSSIYEVKNGVVVFKLPLASEGDVTAFSSVGSTGTVFDQLSTYVDGTTISFDDVSKKLAVVDSRYIKKNSAQAPVSQDIYGDITIHGNVKVTGTVTPNYV